ncbi:unnamed protein product [Merluccius merluccius]
MPLATRQWRDVISSHLFLIPGSHHKTPGSDAHRALDPGARQNLCADPIAVWDTGPSKTSLSEPQQEQTRTITESRQSQEPDQN